MEITEIKYPREKALELEHFREMDYYAVNNYNLPIELMMENAGLQLANLIFCALLKKIFSRNTDIRQRKLSTKVRCVMRVSARILVSGMLSSP